MDRGEFISDGFSARPAVNGGWVVRGTRFDRSGETAIASFSNFAEMIAWLEDQHEGLKIGSMNQKGQSE